MGCDISNLFGDNTGYYFYSSIFQGNMALLALAGVFAIYKLQHLTHNLEVLEDELRKHLEFITSGYIASINIFKRSYDMDLLLEDMIVTCPPKTDPFRILGNTDQKGVQRYG